MPGGWRVIRLTRWHRAKLHYSQAQVARLAPAIAGAITATSPLTPWMTARSGTPQSITLQPVHLTGARVLEALSSPAAGHQYQRQPILLLQWDQPTHRPQRLLVSQPILQGQPELASRPVHPDLKGQFDQNLGSKGIT